MKSRAVLFALCASAPAMVSCASSKLEPEVASSGSLPGYATRYPAEIQAASSAFDTDEAYVEKLVGDFQGYPDKLTDPSWQAVKDVYQLADTDGHSYEYVERVEQAEDAAEFFTDQKQEIERRIGGAAQYAIKDKHCDDVDVATPVRFAFDKAIEKQLEDSVHDRSDAYDAIEQSEDALGKKNVETLKTQTDAISRGSYLVNVGVVREKQKIDRMVSDASDVKSTLDRTIDDLNKLIADPKTPDARKKAANEELATAQQSKNAVDGALATAENAKKTAEDRVKKLRQDYAKGFSALIDDVKGRIK